MLKQILSISAIAAGLFVFSSCEHQPPVRLAITPTDTTGNGGGNTGGKCHPDTMYFNENLPIIVSNCGGAGCHDNATKADGVELTSYSTIMSTGRVVPGNPGESKIYKEMNKGDMPPTGRLSQDIIDKINKWISQGAKNNYCNSVCDSTKFAYTADISKIIASNCISCHNSGNVLLNSHANVQTYALNGRLMGALKHLPGFQPMPNATNFLSDCELKKIQKWIDNGAPNN
jgi:mono/diheme cytochrome c family protein